MKNNNPIHGVKKKGLLDRKWFLELVGGGPPIVAALVGAVKASAESGLQVIAGVLFFSVGWLFIASVLKVRHAKLQDAKEDELRNHDGLVAGLHVLHALVAAMGKLEPGEKDKCLRVTFHRVVPPLGASDHIEQIVPYIGGDGEGVGRKFPIRSGITGKAIRENAVFVMHRNSESYEDYKRELVTEWSYTDSDVKNITSTTFSAMALPIKSSNDKHVLGVVYLDCTRKQFFSSNEMKTAAFNGCAGIARFTGERYV